MRTTAGTPFLLTKADARRIWLRAQRLDENAPFGDGAIDGSGAARRAIEHLGYVQIDTINVIERCHHHILFSRIPAYQRAHLHQAQARDKSVFEYWTHALAYVPARDVRFFLGAMRQHKAAPGKWFQNVTPADLRKVLNLIKTDGPLSIRDIVDDELVEKDHPWASRKPSKRALQLAFFSGDVTVSERDGMLKRYELMARHFGWETRPKPASEREITAYLLDRALLSQGVVSLDSICHLAAKQKPAVRALIEARVRGTQLVPVRLEGAEHGEFWAAPDVLEFGGLEDSERVHILSPFDPLIIQRKRLLQMFGYEHRFEAYLPKEKRVFGYFALPVLVGDRIVAAIDLKTDRSAKTLLIQQWTWTGSGSARRHKRVVEDALGRFERFQVR
jgi:uncharacterized protein